MSPSAYVLKSYHQNSNAIVWFVCCGHGYFMNDTRCVNAARKSMKPMKINENQWKSMQIHENPRKINKKHENPWKPWIPWIHNEYRENTVKTVKIGGTFVAAATLKGGPMSSKHNACAGSRPFAQNVPKGNSRHSRDPMSKDYTAPQGERTPDHQLSSKAFLLGSRAGSNCRTSGSEARVSSFSSHSWW